MPAPGGDALERTVSIPAEGVRLEGTLGVLSGVRDWFLDRLP